ncbi:MAG TPA: response regulator [Pyrinomonadaceae bacterium]|nr:response regulator [Pyrinomonadaceae bacterium]
MANILLVDDEEQLRSMLRVVLEEAGHVVQEASDGQKALESFKNQQPDVVVTDLVMPNKEGIETILELRRIRRDVRIIAMSGGGRNNANDYLALAKRFGACVTLTKPFANKEMIEAVNAALAN